MTIYYDISLPISSDTPVYPGDPRVEILPVCRVAEGDVANVSELRMGSHTGTHIDPPAHMVEGGMTVDEIPPDVLIGECFVCDFTGAVGIGNAELSDAGIPPGIERLVFKTLNSSPGSKSAPGPDFTYLTPEGADWLVSKGIRLVGIDSLTIDDPVDGKCAAHSRLLAAGVIIVEGLDLRQVPEGVYTLVCLPLRIEDGDGSPARAVLIKSSG